MKRLTTTQLRRKPRDGERIVMVTCYDATFARLVDEGGVDAILIGDSLGMVIQGHENTLPVTLDEMIYHCRAVARGSARAHLVGDLPFGSYQTGTEQLMASAARLLKEGGVQSVKLEGGAEYAEGIARLVRAGIPVMGHLGLTPQSVHQLGGYRVQAKTQTAADRLLSDALALQEAGCFSIVLEGIPAPVAERVTAALEVPTIGIGAGVGCSGQVLVLYDLLGLDERFQPKFIKRYDNLHRRVVDAVTRYSQEVRTGAFPTEEHSHYTSH
jgi:3-methyl-2-oxobutanoate hydroxymethyltransferase